MKNILVFCFALLSFSCLKAQTAQSAPDADKVYTLVQTKPNFPGDIHQWLATNIKYPEDAKTANAQGTVYVSFVVEKNGSISNINTLKTSGNTSLDKEGIRVVSVMPKWTPGKQDGQAVRIQYVLPINFKLN